jgi:hypothetical protein
MKVNRLEAHDRLLYLNKSQAKLVSEGLDDCLKKNSLSLAIQEKIPYVYIFLHSRTIGLDEKISIFENDIINFQISSRCQRKYQSMADVPEKRLIWQPRMRKPEAQPNSQLFRAKSHSDELEIMWMIPDKSMWDQYIKGNVTESNIIEWSISQFRHNKTNLEAQHPDDISEERSKQILLQIASEIENKIKLDKIKSNPTSSVVYP